MGQRISKEKLRKTGVVIRRLLVILLGIGIGVLISAQNQSIPDRVTNPISPYLSLKDTKDELYTEQDQLREEIKNLQASIETAQKNAEDVTLNKNEVAQLRYKKSLAGLTKMNGPGIIITLNDSQGGTSEDSIIHAADLRDTLNLLWGSGAEAISVNDQRIVLSSAVDCIVNTIMINGIRLSTPFRIEAIGDQNKMYENVINPFLLADLHRRQRESGIVFMVDKNNNITTPVFAGSFAVKSGGSN